jgi:hypothetical protein
MQVRHYLTFEFASRDEKFVYVVTEETKEGFTKELLHKDRDIDGPVIEFEDITGRKVSVNGDYLRRCQALYDAGVYTQGEEEEGKPDMVIVMEGMREPLTYYDIEPDDAALVASFVAGVGLGATGFVAFTDEDGEDNLIYAEKVMLLDTLHYQDEFDEESPEGAEALARRKKPKAARARKPSRGKAK